MNVAMSILAKQNRWLILVTVTSVVFAIVVNYSKSTSRNAPTMPQPMVLQAEPQMSKPDVFKDWSEENIAHGD